MKYLTSGRILFSSIFVVLFAILIWTAMSYNPAARTMPLIVAIPVFLGAIANLYVDVRIVQRGEKPAKEKKDLVASAAVAAEPLNMTDPKHVTVDVEAAKKKIKKEKAKISPELKRKRELIGIAWLISYVAALILFGFNLATIAYLILFIRFYSHESWKLTIVYSAVLWLFVYVAFVVLLKSNLAPGMVFDWLGL
jgi:disulfide bond formation protein DsbB